MASLSVTMESPRGRRHNYLTGRVSGTGHRGIIRVVDVVGASLTLALLLGILAPHIVFAQENGSKPFTTKAGAYEITVWEDPSNLSAGQMLFVVRVLNAATREPVPDASVVIRFDHRVLSRVGATASNTPDSPEYYKALVNEYAPDFWEISVEATGSLGRGLVYVPSVQVPILRSARAGSLVFIGVSLVMVLAGAYMWRIMRGIERRRETSQADEGPGEETELED